MLLLTFFAPYLEIVGDNFKLSELNSFKVATLPHSQFKTNQNT